MRYIKSFFVLPMVLMMSLPMLGNAQSCPATLTYTPANPVFGQPITATFVIHDIPPPTATSNSEYLVNITASEQGAPSNVYGNNSVTYISDSANTIVFTFTPYAPGQVTINSNLSSFYSFGLTPICGQFINAPLVTITVAPTTPVVTHDALYGQYAFLFQGTVPQESGGSQALAAAGSFTADGQGNITAGIEDVNSGSGSFTKVAVKGTYSIDSAGNGILNLQGPLGPEQFKFFVVSTQLATTLTSASLFSTNGYAIFGNGSLAKQSLNASPINDYAFNLHGDFPCTSTCISGAPVFESGLISFADGKITGNLAASAGSALVANEVVSGTYNNAEQPTGRFTYSLSQGQFPDLNFVGYEIDGPHFFTISTDTHATTYLLSGTASE